LKAIVMAGGSGSRLRPLTCGLPKPMVPVMNRPLMEYSLDLLNFHGLREVAATLQYLPEKIRQQLGDGSRFGLHLQYYVEEEPLGTAGSVKNAADFLDETFIVISGDALTDFDLTHALEFHRQKGAMATLVLTRVDNPLEYGIVITDDDGRITRFVEKPGWGEVFSDTVNTGIYILEPEVLEMVETGKPFDFSKDLFPLLLKHGYPILGVVMPGYWCDIGNMEQYCQAHRDIMEGRVDIRLNAAETEKGIWLEENVDIHPRARLYPPVYIGSGSKLEGRTTVQDSVLGSQNFLAEQVSMKRGITWKGACLEKKSAMRGAVLCNSVRLAPRVSVYENVVIGDDSVIGENTVIKPEVKIWPEKKVESHITLRESLIWGTGGARKLFGFDGIKGEVNRELFPESAMKLAVSFASSLQEKGPLLVGSDSYGASRMFKHAVSAGFLSVGCHVYDLGDTLTPLLRRQIISQGASGGVYIRLEDFDPPQIMLRFMDNKGLNLSRGQERSVEQLFFREDFPRCSGLEVGAVTPMPDLLPHYRREIISGVNLDLIKRAGFRIILGYPAPLLDKILTPLLQELHCRVFTFNLDAPSHEQPRSFKTLRRRRHEVASAVQKMSASLGVIFDPGGEEMILIDEKGRVIEGELYKALLSLLLFRMRRGETVAVPVNASHVIETLAHRHGGKVQRTRTAPFEQMNEFQKNNGEGFDHAFSPLSVNFDCMGALVHLLEYLALQEATLSNLLAEIPKINLRERKVGCPWEKKGKIMRLLIEESATNEVEMVDGLKVYHPEQGWALVLPNPEKPFYHVYGEGYNEEISSSLADFYVRKIGDYIRHE